MTNDNRSLIMFHIQSSKKYDLKISNNKYDLKKE